MLSWANYLFGSGTTEPQPEDASPEPTVPMEEDKTSEPEQDWVVVDYAGRFSMKMYSLLPISILVKPILTLKMPITPAADNKFCDIFPNF